MPIQPTCNILYPLFRFRSKKLCRGASLAPINYAAAANPTSVIIGDFNGDGKLDWPWPTSVATMATSNRHLRFPR
jgi:hypothetical protein